MALLVRYRDAQDLARGLDLLPSALSATVHGTEDDLEELGSILAPLRERVGRLIWNGWPTGVAVGWAQHHGGPWPSTTASIHTSVGATAIRRFLRPVAFQNLPDAMLPIELRDANPLGIPRRINGVMTTDPVPASSAP